MPRFPSEPAAMMAGFEHSGHALLVLEGPDLRLVGSNRAAAAMVGGRSPGTPMREAVTDRAGQEACDLYQRCFDSGETQVLRSWQPLLDLVVTPWLGAEGEILGVVADGRDAADVRQVVHTMQDELLPRGLPVLPRVDLAARYLLADTGTGGDWFDAVVRPDGHVALVVGDVVGDGTTASATMGQLRAVCHERLTSDVPLEQVLTDLDRFARSIPEARHATVCVVELDPATGEGRYCTAGHPPPLVVDGGDSHYLAPTGAGPLATTGELPLGTLHLETEGALVMLYSDGLVERPGTTPAASTIELAETVLAAAAGPGRVPERVCELTLEVMTRGTGYADDITMLVGQRTAAPAPLRVTLPAEASYLAETRRELIGWLDRLDVGDLDQVAVNHAVGELLANVVTHAYDEGSGEMTFSVELTEDGDLRVEVSDQGTWRPARVDAEGRGLTMATGFLDTLAITSSERGTTAVGTFRPHRPAVLMTAVGADQRSARPADLEIVRDEAKLSVVGPVLAETAGVLDRRLRQLTAGGTVPWTVDLSRVSHLGSAGVRVLHDLITTAGADITLVAPYGSVAQHVLDLVQLPYDTP